ncbi:hypothetical protein WAE56_17645 [Iodobacter sp. LRB]|uniref:hypothetical protein n=1 Tax=unclassified Iodobacter TaxID=235634 RepID=UPI0015D4D448|nr:hypothetical protein [Iodobacter sp. BJB302]
MEAFPPLSQVLSKLDLLGISLPEGPVFIDGYGDSPELSAAAWWGFKHQAMFHRYFD